MVRFCSSGHDSQGRMWVRGPLANARLAKVARVTAFDFFAGVPQSILYDNTRLAVAKINKGGERLRSQMFAELPRSSLF
jgi:hypothetical protein